MLKFSTRPLYRMVKPRGKLDRMSKIMTRARITKNTAIPCSLSIPISGYVLKLMGSGLSEGHFVKLEEIVNIV